MIPVRRRLVAFLVGLIACLVAGCATVPLRGPEPKYERWEKEIAAFGDADRSNPPQPGAILFTGSSTVRMWKTLANDFPGHRVINRGFGGCRIEDVTHFADRIVFPHAPRLIVIRGGGNDIADGKTAERVAFDFREFAEAVHARLPRTRIAFLSQNPTVARAKNEPVEREANARIRRYIAGHRWMQYIDIDGVALGADGKASDDHLLSDHLHFNAEGYKLLADRVRPFLMMPK